MGRLTPDDLTLVPAWQCLPNAQTVSSMTSDAKHAYRLPIGAKWGLVLLFLTVLWLRHDIGILAITFAHRDDALFFRTMEHLLGGAWLGPYDQITLAKGVMLPLIGALTASLGIPIKTFEFAIYLAASLLLAVLAGRLTRSWRLCLLLFAMLALNPVFWSHDALRFTRGSLYSAFSLGVFATLAWLLWQSGRSRLRALQATGLGILFGGFWLTREESVWLYPALAVLLLGTLVLLAVRRPDRNLLRSVANRAVLLILAWLCGWAVLALPVMALNHGHYGVFVANEFRADPFRQAVGALMRVRSGPSVQYVPVTRKALAAAYAVSPAAAELRSHLAGEVGERWANISARKLPKLASREFGGGWFVWALRDATAAAGHYTDAVAAAAFYRRLAAEIHVACDDGRLQCGPRRDSLAPLFPWPRLLQFADATRRALAMSVQLDSGDIAPVWSFDRDGLLEVWRQRLGAVAPAGPGNARPSAVQHAAHGRHESETFKLAVVNGYAEIARILFPPLWLTATVGVVLYGIKDRRDPGLNVVLVLILAALVAVATRAALIAYIDTTAWRAVTRGYLGPAYAFGILYAVCGSYLLYRTLRGWRRGEKGVQLPE